MKIELYLTPISFTKANLADKAVVVIDVLRCCTSISAALANGARGVIPTDGPGQAGEMWSKLGADLAILAGERDCNKIDNFQLGNSPSEFVKDVVKDKLIVMTTSNATPVFGKTQGAAAVFASGLVNASSIAEALAAEEKQVAIVCAGSGGSFAIEDTLCGGMLIDLLLSKYGWEEDLNDGGSLALLLYRSYHDSIRSTIERGEHGRHLQSLGFEADVVSATEIDSIPVVPRMVNGQLINQQGN
jgi:2-phosphosulfolactate phosphatase